MDYKLAASGDPAATERSSWQEKCLDYAEQVLDHLLNFAAVPNPPKTPEEWGSWRKDWIQRLSQVPQWKLGRLTDFYSPYITDVWKFFEDLRQTPEYHQPLLPEPDRTPRSVQIAKDFNAHIQKMMKLMDDFKPSRFRLKEKDPQKYQEEFSIWANKKRKIELESFKELNQKYPHLNVMQQIRNEKRFQGLELD